MKYLHKVCGFLIALSTQVIAGQNPIGWSLNHNFPNPVSSGISYSIIYTFTNNLGLTLIRPLVIQKNASSASEFSYTDNCTGKKLTPNEQCTVTVSLNSLVVGEKSVQLAIAGYSKDVVPLPQQVTFATGTVSDGVTGAVSQALPNAMTSGSGANYSFLFTNYGSVNATNVIAQVTQTTGTLNVSYNSCGDNSTPGTIAHSGGTCTVQGNFTPASGTPSLQTVQATLNFAGATGSPSVVSTSTTVSNPSGLIVASLVVPNYLPPIMTPGTTQEVQFLYTNVSSGSVTLTNTGLPTCIASDSSNCSSMLSNTVSQCTNGTLLNGQACDVTTTFTAPAASSPALTYTITGSLGYTGTGSPAAISTSGTVIATLPSTRIIKVVNNCNFNVAYSLNGAAVSGYSSAACPPGTSPNSSTGKCYWDNYVGTTGNMLTPSATDLVTIPFFNYGGTQWSGNISASTGCTGGTCTYATCGNSGGNASCAVGTGFSQPATQAEITMLVFGADNYDIEVINGFHLPISMQPAYYISSNGATIIDAVADDFECGTPGSSSAGNGFGACNWAPVGGSINLPTPTAYYYWVGGGSGNNCNSCQAGELCGLNNSFNEVCGQFLGYWTPNQLCTQSSLPSQISATLQCNTSTGYNLQPPDSFNNTYTSLMACPVATNYSGPTYNSCYSSYPQGSSVTQCCGCVNWWDSTQTSGVSIGANNTSQTCPSGQVNPLWTSAIQPGIQWMKQACPSVYVYPFDDASSKFTCSNNTPGQQNSASYIVTFCPGNSGLPTTPSGITDGR